MKQLTLAIAFALMTIGSSYGETYECRSSWGKYSSRTICGYSSEFGGKKSKGSKIDPETTKKVVAFGGVLVGITITAFFVGGAAAIIHHSMKPFDPNVSFSGMPSIEVNKNGIERIAIGLKW